MGAPPSNRPELRTADIVALLTQFTTPTGTYDAAQRARLELGAASRVVDHLIDTGTVSCSTGWVQNSQAVLHTTPGLIWYVSYGSNVNRGRFAAYIAGGSVVGVGRTYHGCRNQNLPAVSTAVQLPHQLYFAAIRSVWGGATAFIDPNRDNRCATHAVAHLITIEQFADVVVQENGGEAPGRVTAKDLPGRRNAAASTGLLCTTPWSGSTRSQGYQQ